MKPELYILRLSNNQFYIGSTNNLARRMLEHQSGRTLSIKHKLPCRLVFHQEFSTYVEARQAEYFIKKQKSRVFTEKIISQETNLKDILGGP